MATLLKKNTGLMNNILEPVIDKLDTWGKFFLISAMNNDDFRNTLIKTLQKDSSLGMFLTEKDYNKSVSIVSVYIDSPFDKITEKAAPKYKKMIANNLLVKSGDFYETTKELKQILKMMAFAEMQFGIEPFVLNLDEKFIKV